MVAGTDHSASTKNELLPNGADLGVLFGGYRGLQKVGPAWDKGCVLGRSLCTGL